ncbi:MAG: VWA domain-containing protein [Microcystaceae cyanobacterium]
MKVSLKAALSNPNIDAKQSNHQRQLSLSTAAVNNISDHSLPLNLCLVLDHSGSMDGQPLETVKLAAIRLIEQLNPQDSLSVIAFDHRAKVIVPSQSVSDINSIRTQIKALAADGGTSLDEGIKLGIKEAGKGKEHRISQILVLTDGENEHGDNDRCLKLAEIASAHNITLNTLGFGTFWNQDVLEAIADKAGGSLSYIEQPQDAVGIFQELFSRMQSVGLTNAHLLLELNPNVRLAELKPISQVEPETVELTVVPEETGFSVRLGDLMIDHSKVILANLYLGQLPVGEQVIAKVQIRYDDPSISQTNLLSEQQSIFATVQQEYEAQTDETVQKSVLKLAKYRQTQIAEEKISQGDTKGAATLLQTAAKTALQMGDKNAATVLQESATQLQVGEQLSEAQRKKTRIVSKTVLQDG